MASSTFDWFIRLRACSSWASTPDATVVGAATPPGTEPVMFCPDVRSPSDDITAHPDSAARTTMTATATGTLNERRGEAATLPAAGVEPSRATAAARLV